MKNKYTQKLLSVFLMLALCFSSVIWAMPTFVQAASGTYVSNKTSGSKKGLQVDFNIMSDVEELGISEAFINIEFEKLLEKNPATATPGSMVDYTYNGVTYHFHKETVDAYDMAVKRLTDMGANVTVAFVNNEYDPDYFSYMYYVGSNGNPAGVCYFAFNTTAGSQGQRTVQAVCDFVTTRYNGTAGYGKISNFVIGNEVNDNTTYNNAGPMEIDAYVGVYYQTFKTFYDAIKANNPNAQVYIPLENQWAGSVINTTGSYRGKDFIEKFDALSKADGNLNWGLAYHPYANPILSANTLRDNESSTNHQGQATGAGDVTNDYNETAFITMKNLDALTNYMQQASMLNSAGQVRSIILSELGYSSSSNIGGSSETSQAANIAYAYYKAEMNPYIDAFILYQHVTQPDPVNTDAFQFGLWNGDANGNPTSRKSAYYVYKYIDTNRSAEATNFALNYFGIDSWATVIDGFDMSKITGYGKSVDTSNVYYVKAFDYGDRFITTVDSNTFNQPNGQDANGNWINLCLATSTTDPTGTSTAEVSNSLRDATDVTLFPGAEAMKDGNWIPEYAVATDYTMADYGNSDGTGNQQFHPYGGYATDPKAFYLNYQGFKYKFGSAVNTSAQPYLGFEFMAIPKSYTDSSVLEIRVRVFSGNHVLDSNALIPASEFYNYRHFDAFSRRFAGTFFVDLSSWGYKGTVDSVEVWIRDTTDPTGSFDGFVSIQNLMLSSSLHGAVKQNTNTDVSFRTINGVSFNKVTTYCGKDYSAEYDPAAYAQLNPDLATQGINDPYELIEHWVTKGKAEGRQAMQEPTMDGATLMYRLYNPNSGEHFYTGDITERSNLVSAGWTYEGHAWWAPTEGGIPVYRLYNPNAGDHHYTNSAEERDNLVNVGWTYENVCWNDVGEGGTPMYRLYNPNAESGSHHYTQDETERDNLVNAGWRYEGIGWYGL